MVIIDSKSPKITGEKVVMLIVCKAVVSNVSSNSLNFRVNFINFTNAIYF